MIILLSPSKTLAERPQFPAAKALSHTQPSFLPDSERLIKRLRRYSPLQLSELMGISDKLAALNAQRYRDFSLPFTQDNACPALLTFKGDVYQGMEVEHYKKADFTFAQRHLRILSGLYGLLRPLDLMQPYRLEMGTRLPIGKTKDLYGFWGSKLTQGINAELAQQPGKLLVNLASEEYFKAVQPDKVAGHLLTIRFAEKRDGQLKVIGLFAKQARGLMADYIIRNRITGAEGLKDFSERGYGYDSRLSNEQTYAFAR